MIYGGPFTNRKKKLFDDIFVGKLDTVALNSIRIILGSFYEKLSGDAFMFMLSYFLGFIFEIWLMKKDIRDLLG